MDSGNYRLTTGAFYNYVLMFLFSYGQELLKEDDEDIPPLPTMSV